MFFFLYLYSLSYFIELKRNEFEQSDTDIILVPIFSIFPDDMQRSPWGSYRLYKVSDLMTMNVTAELDVLCTKSEDYESGLLSCMRFKLHLKRKHDWQLFLSFSIWANQNMLFLFGQALIGSFE